MRIEMKIYILIADYGYDGTENTVGACVKSNLDIMANDLNKCLKQCKAFRESGEILKQLESEKQGKAILPTFDMYCDEYKVESVETIKELN